MLNVEHLKNEYAEIHKYAIYNHKRHVNIVYC